MKLFETIDTFLLDVFKKIARWFYLTLGITNFGLSSSFIILGISLGLLRSYLKNHHFVFSDGMAVVFCYLWILKIKDTLSSTSATFMNPFRISWVISGLRMVLFVFSPLMIFKDYLLQDETPFYFHALSRVSAFFIGTAFYFASIEPEDPTDSKLTKLLRRFFPAPQVG